MFYLIPHYFVSTKSLPLVGKYSRKTFRRELSALLLGEWQSSQCTQYIGLELLLLISNDNDWKYFMLMYFCRRLLSYFKNRSLSFKTRSHVYCLRDAIVIYRKAMRGIPDLFMNFIQPFHFVKNYLINVLEGSSTEGYAFFYTQLPIFQCYLSSEVTVLNILK